MKMELNRKAQGFLPEYVVHTAILIVIIVVVIGIILIIFSDKLPVIWRSITGFLRFGAA